MFLRWYFCTGALTIGVGDIEMGPWTGLANQWLEWDRDEETRLELQSLLSQKKDAELKKRLDGRITFGTAGLRAAMGAGPLLMNPLTVIQTSQGLASYLCRQDPDASTRGIVIGHDARFNSSRFARLAAAVFVAQGIKVHWFDKLVHTPLVPFAISHLNGAAGIMITASHNPPQDNGYKVYWGNACQIIPPHDVGIAAAIEENLEPVTWNLDVDSPLLSTIDDSVEAAYLSRIMKLAPAPVQIPPFVYTPMHGVGLPFMNKAVSALCQSQPPPMFSVLEQSEPDPKFPTVKFPNPEEKGALDLAIRDANRLGYSLIIANDPDADRLAIAEKILAPDSDSGRVWYQFTGNEVGILLASYSLHLNQTAHRAGKLAMLCSTVSSGMLNAMASAEAFRSVETLTGFKWLGNVAQKLTAEGYRVPYAFEEALGYMFTDVVWDKDGVSSAAAFLAAASLWAQYSLTPYQKLQQLYWKYGYYADANTYLISPKSDVTNLIFAAIRARSDDSSRPYPQTLGIYKITRWRDLTIGYDSATEDHKPELPIDQQSQMITCELENGVRFTIRSSGTEPKIKFYCEATGASFEEAKQTAIAAQRLVIEEWFPSEQYRLKEPA